VPRPADRDPPAGLSRAGRAFPRDLLDRHVRFEHVGDKNYRSYLAQVRQCLHPHGLILLHSIGSNVSRHRTDPWIAR